MNLAIYGAGGLGREVLELVRQMEKKEHIWEKVIFVDEKEFSDGVNGITVLRFDDVIRLYDSANLQFVIAVGEPITRAKLYNKVKNSGYTCAILVHPDVYIPETTILQEGTVIQKNAFISCNIYIGKNVFIQPAAVVGHDVKIRDNSVISMNVSIGGACTINENVYIGLNASVRELVTIGMDSIIGMGAVVIKDIPQNVIALGNPAKPQKSKDCNTVFH